MLLVQGTSESALLTDPPWFLLAKGQGTCVGVESCKTYMIHTFVLMFLCFRCLHHDGGDDLRRQCFPSPVQRFLGGWGRPQCQPSVMVMGVWSGSMYLILHYWRISYLAGCPQSQRWHLNVVWCIGKVVLPDISLQSLLLIFLSQKNISCW